ncbi:MAG: UDP-N-acetylglucosamine--N-acetylmuramyl-(pentapeptide) pyrophosphoryl-undecaprenol N-acetylglucosamine transferase [bacterium]
MNESIKGNNKRLLIIGGDTGGHLYPGIAIAKSLEYSWQISFIIGERPIVQAILKKENYRYQTVPGYAFPKMNILKYIPFILVNLMSIFKSWRVMSEIRPDVIISTGGFMSFAPVISGYFKKIPIILHEQNVRPGLANTVLSRFASRIAVSFNNSIGCFPKSKVFLSGNPIRKEVLDIRDKPSMHSLALRILILGGSQGAHFLNKLMVSSLELLKDQKGKFYIKHITGKNDYSMVKSCYNQIGINAEVYSYHYQVEQLYHESDFLIARAGATTIAEIIALRKPALLIPFLHAANNHQFINAGYLAEQECIILEEENNMDKDKLFEILMRFAKNKKLLVSYERRFELLPEYNLNPLSTINSELNRLNEKYINNK